FLCVVRLSVERDDIVLPLASAFGLVHEATESWFLATCAHVFDDLPDSIVLVQGMGRDGPPRAATVSVDRAEWRVHPSWCARAEESSASPVDLALLPLPRAHPVLQHLRLTAIGSTPPSQNE